MLCNFVAAADCQQCTIIFHDRPEAKAALHFCQLDIENKAKGTQDLYISAILLHEASALNVAKESARPTDRLKHI